MAKRKVTFVDPPSGWMCGFPKELTQREGQTFHEWLEEEGYTVKGNEEIINMATRQWVEEIEDADPPT